MKRLAKGLIGFVLTLTTSYAGAALIDSADSNFTIDTESGLDWLDVTASVGQSYYDVSGQLGSGGSYEGWRYATNDEVESLVAHASNIAVGSADLSEKDGYSFADVLIPLMGSTSDTFENHWHDGIYDDENIDVLFGLTLAEGDELLSDDTYAYFIEDIDDFAASADEFGMTHTSIYNDSYSLGSFLVRSTVDDLAFNKPWGMLGWGGTPKSTVAEPASLLLLALGLFGLSAIRKQQGRASTLSRVRAA